MTSNEFTSSLQIGASIASEAEPTTSLTRSTPTFAGQLPTDKKSLLTSNRYSASSTGTVPALKKGADLQLALMNDSQQKLYVMILGIDADSNIFALYTPIKANAAETTAARLLDTEIKPQTALEFPDSENTWQWKASTTPGIDALYTIFSVSTL